MVRWIKWLLTIGVIAGLALVGCQTLNTDKTFNVSQAQLQKLVNRNWTTTAEKLSQYNLTIATPTLVMQPNEQRVGASFDAFMDLGILKVEGVMHISGKPAYSVEKGAVMLNDMRVDKFEAQNLPDSLIKAHTQKIFNKTFGFDLPIYEMPPEKLSFAGKKWLPQIIEVERDGLKITLAPK